MAAGTPDEKFQRLREENERRRKKKEEEEKRRKQEEEQKAKAALERRRLERLEQDERMRKPWQQPPAPKKPILRKGAKQKPVQASNAAVDPLRQSIAEEKRREHRQGLQAFIQQQRQAAATKTPKADNGQPVVPLTWEELRLAAEAGFDELLRQQDLEDEQRAMEQAPSRATRYRSPYRSPFRGPPAPAAETVQIALVPMRNDAAAAATAEPADGASGPAAAESPGPASQNRDGGDTVPAAGQGAALRNSYKFSDAPASPPGWHRPGGNGGEHAAASGAYVNAPPRQAVDTAVGESSAAPEAVLYPPPAGEAPGHGAWAGGSAGTMQDGAADAANSIASSGGLRRGVTAATRYRAAPVDAASLEVQNAAPMDGQLQGGGEGARSPRSSGQRPPLPGPYDTPSPQQWDPAADPLETSLLAGGTLAALQEADGLRLAFPRDAIRRQQQQQPGQQEDRWHEQQRQPQVQAPSYAPPPPQAQSLPRAHDKADQKPARRGWAMPPQAAAPQQESWETQGGVETLGAQAVSAAVDATFEAAQAPASMQPAPTAQAGAVGRRTSTAAAQSVGASHAHGPPVRHSIGVGDSGGLDMWQRESVLLGADTENQLPAGGDAALQPNTTEILPVDSHPQQSPVGSGDGDTWRTPSREQRAAPVDASPDVVLYSSPITPADPSSHNATPSGLSLSPDPAADTLEQQVQAQERTPAQQDAGFQPSPRFEASTEPPRASVDLAPRPGTASGAGQGNIYGHASPASGPAVCASARVDAGQSVAFGEAAVLKDAVDPPEPDAKLRSSASAAADTRQQLQEEQLSMPLAPGEQETRQSQQQSSPPPIGAPRPSSGSARLPPLPSGFQAVPQPPSLPPLHASGGTAMSAAAGASNDVKQQGPAPLPAPQQPLQPPIRAPSPPASPPRSITPQRFHRQLSASAVPVVSVGSAVAMPPGGITQPRPLSADVADRKAPTSAVAASGQSVPPPAAEAPPLQHVPPPLVLAPEPAHLAPPSAAATPVSPRKPGLIALTPASPSRPAQQSSSSTGSPVRASAAAGALKGLQHGAGTALGRTETTSARSSLNLAGQTRPGESVPVAVSRPTTVARSVDRQRSTQEPPTVPDEPSDEEVATASPQGFREGGVLPLRQAGPATLDVALLGRPPSTAEGSVMSGSHISARPRSGSASRPGTGQRPWGSGYQALMLDDSVSSFDFRLRSAAGSRPTSATCAPPSPPHPLLMPFAPPAGSGESVAGKGRMVPMATDTRPLPASAAAGAPVRSQATAYVERPRGAAQATPGPSGGMAAAHVGSRSSAVAVPNALQVLQPAAGAYNLYSDGDGDADGVAQPFTEEPVGESPVGSPERQQQQQHQAAVELQQRSQSTLLGADATDAAAPSLALIPPAAAGAADPDLDDLMREIQALSALRKALKAEFESMGRGEAVAGLGTLSANFAPGAASGNAGEGEGQAPMPADPPRQLVASEQPQATLVPQAVAVAAPAAAPLLQWSIPGVTLAAPSAPALAPVACQPQPAQAQDRQQEMNIPIAAQPSVQYVQTELRQQQHQQPTAAPVTYQQQPPQAHTRQQEPSSSISAQRSAQYAQPELLQQHKHQQPALQVQPSFPHPAPRAQPVATYGVASLVPETQLPLAQSAAPQVLAPAAAVYGLAVDNDTNATDASEDSRGQSFAFQPAAPFATATAATKTQPAAPTAIENALPGPLPVAPPVVLAPPAAVSPSAAAPLAALQWTIPASNAAVASGGGRSSANGLSPQRAPRASGGGAVLPQGVAVGPTSASGCSTPTKAASQPKRAPSGGGYAAQAIADSPVSSGTRSGTAHLTAANASRGAAAAAAATERPLINEGSYVQAALQARERAERERAAREALQAESAAAKAAALNRSRSEKAATAVGAAVTASPSGPKEAGPLGPKAPSSIGSYVRQPSPSPSRPPARSTSTGRSGGGSAAGSEAPSAAGTPAGSAGGLPGTAAAAKQAWGTPTASRPASRIPTPPRATPAASETACASAGGKPSAAAAPAASTAPSALARQDSYDSDLDFLERASDVSDTETDSPSAYGISASPSPPPPKREAFASPSAAAQPPPGSANRERLEGGRPRPLCIPASVASTPMGGASTASTVASHAVPTGGKAPNGGRAVGAARGNATGGAAGRKLSTPFTAAIRELMGLPGSAPLEQARPLPAAGSGRAPAGAAAGGPWPERLSAEEEQLLASLKRLDAEVLRKGLMAAGLINEPSAAAADANRVPPKGATPSKARAAAGAAAGKAAGGAKADAGAPLTNSVQQDQLRESLDKLDVRLGALRKKMEDRACSLGMPSAAAAASAGTVSAAPPAAARAQRDATPTREDRRGPPATLAKSRTPTPNKAKAIRDQRQQQLSNAQGPTPPPARAAPAPSQPKPASAPVMGSHDAAPGEATLQQPIQQGTVGGRVGAAAAALTTATQPHGMPPRAPVVKAPASAPSGPAAVSSAADQQQQQMFGGMPMFAMPPGQSPAVHMPYGPMQAFGMHPMQMAPGVPGQLQQPGQAPQQQVAYVAAMLPNGQVAYVPQFVGGPGAAGGFPGFAQAPQQQQPFMMMMGQDAPGQPPQASPMMPQGMMFPGAQQQQGGPMLAWAAAPQGAAQAHNGQAAVYGSSPPSPHHSSGGAGLAAPSLYSFDRTSNAGHGVGGATPYNAHSNGAGGAVGHAEAALHHHQQQQQQQQQALPYATTPPPTGPLPHYHSTVMRTRSSFGSRDGEAAAVAAMAAGVQHSAYQQHPSSGQPQYGHGHGSSQAAQYNPHPGSQVHSAPGQYGAGAVQPGQDQPSQPHPVQFQTFGPKGSSRGVGATAGWASDDANSGASVGDGGVIKAVNLGLLLS